MTKLQENHPRKPPNNAQISHLAASHFLEALLSLGVEHFCASPGFRNSPLIQAAALLKSKGLKLSHHIDERGAAFFALGLSKSTGKAAVAFCTSGTALANYHPAVLEASYANIPLIVISADRPFEAIGTGANQSMRQENFFGGHVRTSVQIPALESLEQFSYLRFSAQKTFQAAMENRPGPVHVNMAFREPFLANEGDLHELPSMNGAIPKGLSIAKTTAPQELDTLEDFFKTASSFALALGPAELPWKEIQELAAMAEKKNIPLLAEASSGACFTDSKALCSPEALFRSRKISPQKILRIGGPLTSKSFNGYLAENKCQELALDFPGEMRSPALNNTAFLGIPKNMWAVSVLTALEKILAPTKQQRDLFQQAQQAQSSLQKAMAAHLNESTPLYTEWHLAQWLTQNLPSDSLLFLGNSMPIRDFDAVAGFFPKKNNVQVYANRGLSGIDGLLASAAGLALGSKKTSFAVIGDLSALYDSSALSLLNRLAKEISLCVIIPNNGGGEIFNLVGTKDAAVPRELFTTPQTVDFEKLFSAFSFPFVRTKNIQDLRSIAGSGGVQFVELLVDATRNKSIRKDFYTNLANYF